MPHRLAGPTSAPPRRPPAPVPPDRAVLLPDALGLQRTVLDLMGDPAWIKDLDGHYLMVNEHLARLVGSPPASIEGRTDAEIWEADQARAFRADDRAVVDSGEVQRGVHLLARPCGPAAWLEITRLPVRNAEGWVVGVAGQARDVTERLELEARRERDRDQLEAMVRERTAELEQANARLRAEMEERERAEVSLHRSQKLEALGRLAGGVVHDVNNLLAVVKSCAEALHLGIPPEEVGELAFEIAEAARRGTALTRQLLAFSRREPVEPRDLDLNPLVAGMAGMLERLIPRSVRIAPELSPGSLPVRADPGQVEQVIMNLVVNARDALPQGGTIAIRTGRASPDDPRLAAHAPGRSAFAVLTVSDDGTGMSEEVLARIFEPFFTTKEPGKGTGLGLATVFGNARQCGGFVTVDSLPGQGSIFRVYLPLAAAQP